MTNTYLFFCAKCNGWSTGQTNKIRNYRFSCGYCSSKRKVFVRGERKVIFKGPYEERMAVHLCKEINVLKKEKNKEKKGNELEFKIALFQ